MVNMKILFLIITLSQVFNQSHAITVECEFNTKWSYHIVGGVYRCDVKYNTNITSYDEAQIDSINGNHVSGYSNSYVYAFDMRNKLVRYFPRGIEKFFGGLQVIFITDGQLRHLNQTDMKPFTSLKVLDLEGNDLGVLEEGVFDFNTNLQWVSLSRNKIFHVDLDVFENLASMSYLNFIKNKCLNKDPAYDSASVKQLVVDIKASCKNDDYIKLNNTLKGLKKELRTLKLVNFKTFSDQLFSLENDFKASKFSYSFSFNERLEDIKYDKKFTRLANFYLIETKIEELEGDGLFDRANKLDLKFETLDNADLEDKLYDLDDTLEIFYDKFSSWEAKMMNKIEMGATSGQSGNVGNAKKIIDNFDRKFMRKIDKSFVDFENRLIKLIEKKFTL